MVKQLLLQWDHSRPRREKSHIHPLPHLKSSRHRFWRTHLARTAMRISWIASCEHSVGSNWWLNSRSEISVSRFPTGLPSYLGYLFQGRQERPSELRPSPLFLSDFLDSLTSVFFSQNKAAVLPNAGIYATRLQELNRLSWRRPRKWTISNFLQVQSIIPSDTPTNWIGVCALTCYYWCVRCVPAATWR